MSLLLGLRVVTNVDAVADADGGSPRWELVPAWFGSGVWLVAVEGGGVRAWAPPGVRLCADDGEELAAWRRALWAAQSDSDLAERPTDWEPCTLTEVLADVPDAHTSWVVESTCEAVELLRFFADGAPAADSEARAAAQHACRLQGELDDLQVASAKVVGHPAVEHVFCDASSLQSAFRALSDCDFTDLVRRLVSAEWQAEVEHRHGALGRDVFVGQTLGRQHVFHVFHDPRELPRNYYALAPSACHVADDVDVTWCVTSQVLDGRWRACWGNYPGGLIGAAQLQGMLRTNPGVARQHLKLRLAGAGAVGANLCAYTATLWAQLPHIAETEALCQARRRLRCRGALVITGRSGSGKTTLGQLLIGEAALDGYTPFPCHGQPEADGAVGRAIFIDDVPEPEMLEPWISRAAGSDDMLLVAVTDKDPPPSLQEYTLHLRHCDRLDRSRIIYNQLWPMLVRQWRDSSAADTRAPLPLAPVVEACQDLLRITDFTPRMAVNRLRATFGRVSDGFRAQLDVEPPRGSPTIEEDDPLLRRLRRGWVSTPF